MTARPGGRQRSQPMYVLYTAVLPAYRTEFVRIVTNQLGRDFTAFTGDAHTDPTVQTGVPPSLYVGVKNMKLFSGRALVQLGHWWPAVRAECTVLDLNPRSLTSWILLITRRIARRRTIVWGHLFPRRGSSAGTSILRRTMRNLANGTLLYGYDSVIPAVNELPNQPVWVAPNALYAREDIRVQAMASVTNRILYVGRL